MSVVFLVARLPLDVRDFRPVLARLLERMSRPGTAHIRPLLPICPVCKVLAMRSFRALHIAAVCAFVVPLAAGCASAPPTSAGTSLWYSCCATDVVTTVWHPGQQVRIAWTPSGSQAIGARMVAPMTLTVVLTGPYRTTGDLKDANKGGPDRSSIVAAAPVIKLFAVPVRSPVSVVTIPSDAAPGSYNLSFTVASGAASSSGASVITVA